MTHVTEIPGRPTVVLVHGAFADGSSWNGVIERLHAKGISVAAPANPLRGWTFCWQSAGHEPGEWMKPDSPISCRRSRRQAAVRCSSRRSSSSPITSRSSTT